MIPMTVSMIIPKNKSICQMPNNSEKSIKKQK